MTSTDLRLPYSFDTSMNGRWVLIGLWGAVPMLVFCYATISLMAGLAPDELMLAGGFFALVAVADIFMGQLLYKNNKGAKGTISAHMVQVTADRFLGLHSSAPEGTFTLQQFEKIALKQTSVKGVKLGQVSLIGKDKAHTIKLISTAPDKAEALAAFLSKELNLPRDNS